MPEPQTLPDGYVGTTEAARYLALSTGRLYILMDRGDIPFHRFGRHRRIAWADLRAYAESRRVTIQGGKPAANAEG